LLSFESSISSPSSRKTSVDLGGPVDVSSIIGPNAVLGPRQETKHIAILQFSTEMSEMFQQNSLFGS
jgi:hypothetical protein